MANPTLRVLAVLELLQTHGLMSGANLATRLGVDTRTLRRYIATLEEMGIPIIAERGRDGGYRLMHSFKLPPMMFTNDEALAMALGLVAARGMGLGEAVAAGESALAKLERVMPETLRPRVRAVGATVALDMSHAKSAGDPDILATLSTAAQAQQRVHLTYRTPQGDSTARDFDPYGLAYRWGNWYVVGHCHLRRGHRSFRLDRIQSARPLPASFGKPTDFDAMTYLNESVAAIPRAYSVRVCLHTDMAQARSALFMGLGVLEPVEQGVLLYSEVDCLDWMARELARLPFAFEVQAPVELNHALREHAQQLLRYAAPAAGAV